MALLLMDLDETLLDRTATFRRWATEICRECGADADAVSWLIEEDRGGYRSKDELVRLVNDRLAPTTPLTVDGFRRSFAELFRCEPHVLAALADARSRGWTLAIVTNGSAVQLEKVAHSGLSPAVDAVLVSEIEGCRKPDPLIVRRAAERSGQTLEGAWFIGDNPSADIGAAHAAGIRSVWLHRGRPWVLDDFAPTAEADDVAAAITVATS